MLAFKTPEETPNLPKVLHVCEHWFGESMRELFSQSATLMPHGLLMGCPIWGQVYLERFHKICLATMMSEHNYAALRGRTRLELFADMSTYAHVTEVVKGLDLLGIYTRVHMIPEQVMAMEKEHSLNKYWVLGTSGSINLKQAARYGMAYHMMLPDHAYGEHYFTNLWRLGARYEAIAQPGISAEISTAMPEIEAFRQEDNSLVIPDRDLGDIGYRHLHKQTLPSIMNRAVIPDSMPGSHFMMWQGQDRLYLSAPHMNAVYMAPKIVAKAPTSIPATLDTQLPYLMRNANAIHITEAGDGLTYIELSDENKESDESGQIFLHFAARAWNSVNFQNEWMPFYKTMSTLPIHPREVYLEEAEIRRQHADVIERLIACKPNLMEQTFKALSETWR